MIIDAILSEVYSDSETSLNNVYKEETYQLPENLRGFESIDKNKNLNNE